MMRRRLWLKLLGVLVTSLLGMTILSGRAHAYTLHPDPGPLPAPVYNWLTSCTDPAITVITWLAKPGEPQTTSWSVPYGTTSVQIELHDAGAVCSDQNHGTDVSSRVDAASSGVDPGLVGYISGTHYDPYNDPGLYSHTSVIFTFNLPSQVTQPSDYTIVLTSRTVERFNNNTYQCVPSTTPTTGQYDFGPCPSGQLNLTFHLDPLPAGYNVQGYRVYGGSNTPFPSNCGTAVAGGQSTQNNPFNMGPFTGTISMYSDAPSLNCGGIIYNYTSSSLCYNSTVVDSGHCSDGNPTSSSSNVPRNPSDPTTRSGGPPYYIDIRFYYTQAPGQCPNVPNTWQQINFNLPSFPQSGTFDGPVIYTKFNPTRNYFYRYSYAYPNYHFQFHQISSIQDIGGSGYSVPVPGGSGTWYNHSDPNAFVHGIQLNYQYFFNQNPNRTYTPQITYYYNYTYDAPGPASSTGTGLFYRDASGNVFTSNGDPTIPAIANTSSYGTASQNWYTSVIGPSLGPCTTPPPPPPPLSCSVQQAPATINSTARFGASGGSGAYSWTGGGSPSSGVGTPFSTSWSSYGPHTVTVRSSDGQQASCSVTIPYPPPSCNPPSPIGSPIQRQPNQLAFLSASGGDGSNYVWSAPSSSNPGPVPGATWSGSYSNPSPPGAPYQVTVSSGGNSASCYIKVEPPPFEPYLRVYGGDVAAGSGFGGYPCTAADPNDKGNIWGFNNGNGAGSGVQFGAFALNLIDQFTSANGGSGSPVPPKGLSFSNTAGDATYGGNFGKTWCATDYWSTNNNVHSGNYAVTSGTMNVPNGAKTAIYVHGNAYINDDILYADNTWTKLEDVPSFYLVVKGGNIYIKNTVQTLNGVFVAIPESGTGGTIYTCAYNVGATTTLPAPGNLHANCQTQLKIYGAFIAHQVKFQRSRGDIGSSSSGQPATDSNIAEVFIYGPELWITTPAAGYNPATTPQTYDSITGLPPVL